MQDMADRPLYEVLMELSDEMDKWSALIDDLAGSTYGMSGLALDIRRTSGALRQRCISDAAQKKQESE